MCCVRLEEATVSKFVVSVPGTEYVLQFAAGGSTSVAPGKRVVGTITGRAQKFHRPHAGGEFIEELGSNAGELMNMLMAVDVVRCAPQRGLKRIELKADLRPDRAPVKPPGIGVQNERSQRLRCPVQRVLGEVEMEPDIGGQSGAASKGLHGRGPTCSARHAA